MSAYLSSASRPRRSSVIALLVAAAVLHLAKEVLIPVAVAILLAFLLAPAVRRLEAWKLGRLVATLIVSAAGFGVIFAVAGIAANQGVSLAAKLPEYRQNIVEKIHALREPKRDTDLGKAAEAIKDLQQEAAPERPPIPVKDSPATPLEALGDFIAPVAKPLGMALAVIVLTILMLLNRENLRERVLALLGPARIHLMTKAMSEASYRVSRYLVTQLVVNALFGIPFGIALWLIGIPNALLFGLLGMVLRFIPYAGVWIAVAMPAALAFAISDSWTPVAWTLGVFLALETLLAWVIEPWLYGKSAGLSPIAIIAAVIFWTWLWGPIGLLLATPLTVCVAVMGRYIPEFGYLNVLLGVEPVLEGEQRVYQRLVALDHDAAAEVVEKHAATRGIAAAFDELMVPALSLAEHDRRKGALEPARERFIFESARRIVDELEASLPDAGGHAEPVCIAAAHDAADSVTASMLARLLPGTQSCVIGAPARAAEIVETVKQRRCRTLVISALPPHAAHYAAELVRPLRRQLPEVRIVIGLWGAGDALERSGVRLHKLGAHEVVGSLAEAAELLRRPAETFAKKDLPQRAGRV